MKKVDYSGKRFGKLTVVSEAPRHVMPSGQSCTMWNAVCDCGNTTVVYATSLARDRVKSCGCLQSERMRKRNTVHGMSRTRLYVVWHDMKQRTGNPKSRCYERYGGRGITVCDLWKNDFKAFADWAFEHGYDPDAPKGACTLERIDNDKG